MFLHFSSLFFCLEWGNVFEKIDFLEFSVDYFFSGTLKMTTFNCYLDDTFGLSLLLDLIGTAYSGDDLELKVKVQKGLKRTRFWDSVKPLTEDPKILNKVRNIITLMKREEGIEFGDEDIIGFIERIPENTGSLKNMF
mgnify:CR=1 FL=1